MLALQRGANEVLCGFSILPSTSAISLDCCFRRHNLTVHGHNNRTRLNFGAVLRWSASQSSLSRNFSCLQVQDSQWKSTSLLLKRNGNLTYFPWILQRRNAIGFAKRAVDAAPLKLQPYLRLMRADRPIGTP